MRSELACPQAAAPLPLDRRPVDQVFRDLVAQHKDRLYRFVYKHIGHSAEAEDLAQQAFVEAARTYERFRGESQLSTWLYGIAMNLVRNHLSRAPQRQFQFEDLDGVEQMAADQADPTERIEMQQLTRQLEQELAGLMPEMREVLLLVALDDMSYEDAAALLSVPIGTVRSRVSRARAHLRRRFSEARMPLPF